MRSPDVANVFFIPEEGLHCLECKSEIIAHVNATGEEKFHFCYSSNENPIVNEAVMDTCRLQKFFFYKFCTEACCAKWVSSIFDTERQKELEEAAITESSINKHKGFNLEGIAPGMNIRKALALINKANGVAFQVRKIGETLFVASSSRVDADSNRVLLRGSTHDEQLVEFRADTDIIQGLRTLWVEGEEDEFNPLEHYKETLRECSVGKVKSGSKEWLSFYMPEGVQVFIECVPEKAERGKLVFVCG